MKHNLAGLPVSTVDSLPHASCEMNPSHQHPLASSACLYFGYPAYFRFSNFS